MADFSLVDSFINMPFPPGKAPKRDDSIKKLFGGSKALMEGYSVEEMVSDMDAAGVEKSLLTTRRFRESPDASALSTSYGAPDDFFDETCREVADAASKYPGRFYGIAMIDPMGGMRAVRQLERAVKEFGFVGCRIMPAVVGIPTTHALYYPIYTKCIELGVPLTTNLGVPGPLRPAELQRPINLDQVLLAFPELVVVGTHIGHPWHLETLALLQKHRNFYLSTAGFAPKYVPDEIIHFMNSRGAHKVMWASDFPILLFDRTVKEGKELPLKEETHQKYLRDNCLNVFKMD